ncbi:MAG: hypothetical protein OXC09_00475 [Truepera sp.]|nr:hypothetical protein [Truepera sp.]
MMIDLAQHTLTREEREKENKILAGHIEGVLYALSKKGSVSNELYISLRKRLEELDLLPEKPLGTSFYRYVGQLVKPLRAGVKETQDFVKNWKGW